MFWLILTTLCSVWIILCFKVFQRFKLDFFQVIVFNYWTCVATAWVVEGHFPVSASFFQTPKIGFALVLGFCFVLSFNLVALTVRKISLTVASILQKMTLIMTTIFAFWMYGEEATLLKVSGIVLAATAIILTNIPNKKPEKKVHSGEKNRLSALWILPLATFITCSLVDIGISYAAKTLSDNKVDPEMISAIFGCAGAVGLLGMMIALLRKTIKFNYRNIIGGIILGVPNYGSLYFLLKAFESGLDISLVFPTINMSSICLIALLAFLIFKERLSPVNIIGVIFALVSIALISFG